MLTKKNHGYLGTQLDPLTYYRERSQDYSNPHAVGIGTVLGHLRSHLTGKILDFGCGDGLATKLLGGDCIGLDQSPEMINRFQTETGKLGFVCRFWDELPVVDSVISIYAMHLCPLSRMPTVWFRLYQSGAKHVVTISPFKDNPQEPKNYFELVKNVSLPVGPEGKTIHGKVYSSKR